MPGARLTHEDRRQIAAWLADGQGYAEIARRLGRPTSTISREVARNSELGHYLPDRAQSAATGRIRQHWDRAVPPATGERAGAFVEEFATLLTGTGFPRMSARMFVCLLTADSGSVTSADLVSRLRVSPASVSKSIAYLERMNLVVRRADPGRRREQYVIVDDVWLRAWRTDTGAHARVADAAERGTEIFGPDTPAGVRLGKMGRFFAWLSAQMSDSGRAGTTTIAVTLAVPDAAAAARWYARALGATELWTRDGEAALTVGGAPFFLGRQSPGATARIFVDRPDAFIEGATAAGADRIRGGFLDPYGHRWLVDDRSALAA